jgi:hypothetical protein
MEFQQIELFCRRVTGLPNSYHIEVSHSVSRIVKKSDIAFQVVSVCIQYKSRQGEKHTSEIILKPN